MEVEIRTWIDIFRNPPDVDTKIVAKDKRGENIVGYAYYDEDQNVYVCVTENDKYYLWDVTKYILAGDDLINLWFLD